jgi:hypothetical protein
MFLPGHDIEVRVVEVREGQTVVVEALADAIPRPGAARPFRAGQRRTVNALSLRAIPGVTDAPTAPAPSGHVDPHTGRPLP